MKTVIVVGDGWGAVAVVKGLLQSEIDFKVHTEDETILELLHNDAAYVIDDINSLRDEFIVFAGYKPIVSDDVLNSNDCLNIHYSLLPQYRGLHSTVWAMLNNEPYLGLTVHRMDQYIDNGDIIYQYKVANDKNLTSYDFMTLFNQHIEANISEVLTKYSSNLLTATKQDKSQASWVGKRTYKHCQIDFTQGIDYLKNFFRALVLPYPLPYINHKGSVYQVVEVDYFKSTTRTDEGRILNIDNEGIWIKCKDGYLILKEMIDENNERVEYSRFKIGQYVNK